MTVQCSRCSTAIHPDTKACAACGAPAPVATLNPDVDLTSSEDKRAFISPTGAAIAVICFFLPWVQVSCTSFGGREIRSVSGADIGGILWLVFIAALAIVLAVFFYRSQNQIEKARPVVLICSIIAFAVMLIEYVRFSGQTGGQETPFGRIRPEDLGFTFSLQIGGIGTVIGFLLAMMGSAYLKPRELYSPAPDGGKHVGASATQFEENNVETHHQPVELLQPAQVNIAEQIEKMQVSLANLAERVGQWAARKDISGWAKRRALPIVATVGGVLVLTVVYYAFIKPSPRADGKTAALAFLDCQTRHKANVDSVFKSFLDELDNRHYRVRSDARQKLEALLSGDRQLYGVCAEAANAKYQELTGRYKGDSDSLSVFAKAFAENNGSRKAATEIEQASTLFAAVNKKIQSIRAPFPDASQITESLIGQHVDGWSFSYASEFKGVKVISRKLEGDSLVLRTHLDLEDAATKERYVAILDLKYGLNSNGEWDYLGQNQLLHSKADDSYLLGNDIFLVGKWRWEGNYATYNSDGTWIGRWDNGTQATGEWRIVNGNLVLTREGQNWLNSKIIQFSRGELLVGEGTPLRAERVE